MTRPNILLISSDQQNFSTLGCLNPDIRTPNLDRHGNLIANLGAQVAMACKFLNLPGEQHICYYPDGGIRVWADVNAEDTDSIYARYSHPFYTTNRRITGVGYNLVSLGGI